MHIFNSTKDWPDKVNFVDDNNVALGYNMEEHCSGWPDWFIADEPTAWPVRRVDTPDGTPAVMPGWNFDISYIKEVELGVFDGGGMRIFRITNAEGAEKFLHIFNEHNGCYGCGFDFKVGETVIKEGGL